MTKEQAYAFYGTRCRNSRWSWSACSDDESVVVLTFWADQFSGPPVHPVTYDDTNWNDPAVAGRLGNRFRKQHIQHAIDHLEREVRVVFAIANNADANPRRGTEWRPLPNLRMRIIDFNPETGEWTAESIA